MNRFPYVPLVLETQYEDATFLYLQWWYATSSQEPNSEQITRLVKRLDANLNGLLIHAQSSLERAFSEIDLADLGELFVAAFLAYQTNHLDRIKEVVDLGSHDTSLFRAVADALSWRMNKQSTAWTMRFLSSSKPGLFSLGFYAFNLHEIAEPETKLNEIRNQLLIEKKLTGPVLSLMLEAIKLSQDVSAIPLLRNMSQSEINVDSLQILKTRISMGDTTAIPAFQPYVVSKNDWQEESIRFIFPRLEEDTAKHWIAQLWQQHNCERLALIAIGALRAQELLPWVLQKMEDPQWARIAGQAFSSIMGLDLAAEGLALSSSEWDETWFDISGDEELDWPDVNKIKSRFLIKVA